jgi:GH18 family chitinase
LCPAGQNPLDRQHVVVCYVAEWAHRRQGLGKFTVDDIDPTLCTHLVFAFAVLNMTSNAIESAEPAYDLEENNGTGWWIRSAVQIVSCVNLSQVQEVQWRTADCDTMLGSPQGIERSAFLVVSDVWTCCDNFSIR